MSAVSAFGLALAGVVLLYAAMMACLHGPLFRFLRELCGTTQRAEFWTVLSTLAMGASALLLGLLGYWWGEVGSAVPVSPDHPLRSAVQMARGSALGLLAGLIALATSLCAFTARLPRDSVDKVPPRSAGYD